MASLSSSLLAPSVSPSSTDKSPSNTITALKSLLTNTLRITTTDNRVFIGTFMGTDQLLNIILVNTEEYILGNEASRFVGQIMLPWRLVLHVEAFDQHNPSKGKAKDNRSLYI
ncbi:uncharacterized protein EDB91DRAFT_1062148 [Suillus paluster]|uniref:uncharacterized protein n=1 Tax=Suillus paluster TaxID=48578 RepID=UPI001B87BEDE|nr:uncharacterized protein EDB91DRAFT_1062148 [Suillus paluster]KAG1725587.1 hypothetical protein EDB91DRAFT_1062148 [Suillus paluster]